MINKRCRVGRIRRTGSRTICLVLGGLLGGVGCSPRDLELDSGPRGDLAFAQGDYEEALAEYRLALSQSDGEAPELEARLAHTYAALGKVDEAARHYESIVEDHPEYGNQAVADLMQLATGASASGDRFAMARAVEVALEIRPGIGLGPPPIRLARHYFRNGEYGRALAHYHAATADAADSSSAVVFETGRAHEEIGDCKQALVYFERFREMVSPWERGEVDWFIGSCSFQRARELKQEAGSGLRDSEEVPILQEEAVRLMERTIEVGVPRNLQARAWFEKGELLSDMGLCSAAMEALAQVRFADPMSPLVARAQSNFDIIRFQSMVGRCR